MYNTYKAAKPVTKSSDGFEFVGRKKVQEASDSSDVEEQLPVMLGVKIVEQDDVRRFCRDLLTQPFSGLSFKKMSNQEQEDIAVIKQLLQRNSKVNHFRGWQLVDELIVPCLNVDRDEEIADNSRIFGSFQRDLQVGVAITAVIYVREKILIGLAAIDGQEVEEKLPVVILAKNDWFNRQQAANLAEKTVFKAGAFKALYEKILSGSEIAEENSYVTGEVALSGGREAKTVTAHMFAIKKGENFSGLTFIQ